MIFNYNSYTISGKCQLVIKVAFMNYFLHPWEEGGVEKLHVLSQLYKSGCTYTPYLEQRVLKPKQ